MPSTALLRAALGKIKSLSDRLSTDAKSAILILVITFVHVMKTFSVKRMKTQISKAKLCDALPVYSSETSLHNNAS